ncbi:MAG: amidohydrolase family protein [Planctomycetota bacterium]
MTRHPLLLAAVAAALAAGPPAQRPSTYRCAHVLAEDGMSWRGPSDVLVLGPAIALVQPAGGEAPDVDFGDAWLIPGLIDLHTHVCLHPYDETPWHQQVLEEPLELRSMRAVAHARATLAAGFVAIRDLGTEGAGFADVALQRAVRDGLVPGPRVFASTRAIVATGCYGPNLPTVDAPKGAEPADGEVGVRVAARRQIAAGAQWIKVYADYRRAPNQPSTPTFTLAELTAICDEARTAGVPVAAHANTDEGIRRAVLAGVRTIEHGSLASDDTLRLMVEKGVVLCPCLAANEAIVRYAGHQGPIADRLNTSRIAFQRALAAGVAIACGSDAGVFRHGDNARELELMVEYGMTPAQALAAATATAAKVLGGAETGRIAKGPMFGFVVLAGDPLQDIHNLRRVRAVVTDEGGDRLPGLR